MFFFFSFTIFCDVITQFALFYHNKITAILRISDIIICPLSQIIESKNTESDQDEKFSNEAILDSHGLV